MPRPSQGYTNSAGVQIPGCSDITGRFKNRGALMFWAFKRGREGHTELYDRSALDIGTAVHTMAELDMKGEPDEAIKFYLEATLRDPEHIEKARTAFAAFRKWRAEFAVEPHVQEISLVSEKLQYGGTLDNVAHIRRGLGLIDLKTSSSGAIYADMILQLAGYDILWEETHPNEPLTEGYHLIVLPKDGSKPIHREFTAEQLHPFRQQFWLLRKAYDYDAICSDPALLKGSAVKPSRAKPTKPKTVVPPPRERITVTPRPTTMAEVLRTYGHLRNGATA